MYKVIYGIPAMFLPKLDKIKLNKRGNVIDTEFEDDEDPWFDFELDYIPSEDYYMLGFETFLSFDDPAGARKWITYCLSCLTVYMEEHGYDTSKELSLYDVFTEGMNVNTHFKSIEEAYAFLKIMVYGFNGKGLEG